MEQPWPDPPCSGSAEDGVVLSDEDVSQDPQVASSVTEANFWRICDAVFLFLYLSTVICQYSSRERGIQEMEPE
ncbi:hypothetical protein F7725_013891 [Dissostichus mawsoni]|uniref:Uncharacterized protein n=1 Tax=Dissostichus mawsoni TaxID=36200 RepID=A0A7J5YVI6_DISMA|nr:hypothetical protein F7725_013891 [Dissostichus mawsoni]